MIMYQTQSALGILSYLGVYNMAKDLICGIGKIKELFLGQEYSSVHITEDVNNSLSVHHIILVPNRIAQTLTLGQSIKIYIEPLL